MATYFRSSNIYHERIYLFCIYVAEQNHHRWNDWVKYFWYFIYCSCFWSRLFCICWQHSSIFHALLKFHKDYFFASKILNWKNRSGGGCNHRSTGRRIFFESIFQDILVCRNVLPSLGLLSGQLEWSFGRDTVCW